jgi:hypothetical protein
MEMDWGTAISGLIAILLCVFPFVLMYYNMKKKENKMLQSLDVIVQQNNCKISQHEFCGDFVLGIDESRNFVFFFKQNREEAILKFVDLAEILKCQSIKKNRTLKHNKESVIITERVELCFIPLNKSKGEIIFELYDEETNMQMNGELQFVDKWSKLINDLLKKKKPVRLSPVAQPIRNLPK